MKENYHKNRRILVIDDNKSIHEDFRAILGGADTGTATMDEAKAAIFGAASDLPEQISFEVDSAFQGQEGLDKIQQALHESRPYEVIFVDMRMPPGWDGLETIERIWKIDPDIQVVICTAYSDHSWAEITKRLRRSENLLILKKPFDNAEVAQLASALTEKWILARQASMKTEQLEQMVKDRTAELTETNKQLEDEVSKHKRTEKALSRNANLLRMIIDATKEAMITIGDDGLVNLFNPAAEEMFGRKKEEMIGRPLDCLMPDEFRQRHRQYLKGYFTTGKPDGAIGNTIELPALRSDGSTFLIEMSLSAGTLDKQQFVIAVARDITERKQVESKQADLLTKVDNINRELKDFTSIVSHDLKAPLRGIKTLANWILSDCEDKLDQDSKEQMNLLLARVERMYHLIEGALQYSRVGRAEEKQVQIDLDAFLPEVIDMVVPPENITVTIENKLPAIKCEETHIMQLFQNLLSNAIKYMDKQQGWIKIGCVEDDDVWKFSVADNGPGIEEKHFEKIFKMFQALRKREEFEGTGVGLTVTKKIVELYGGKIWVESKVGEGSTFFFTLPKREMGVSNAELKANIVSRR